MVSQEDANLYFLDCLKRGSVHVGVAAPAPPYNAGQLWFSTEETELTLFIYDGNDWVVASPPVSLDGIEDSVSGLQMQVDFLAKSMTPAESHLALAEKHNILEGQVGENSQTNAEQDEKLNELGSTTNSNSDRLDEIDEKFEELDRTLAVGKWRFIRDGSTSNPQNGEFTLTRVDGSQPCGAGKRLCSLRSPRLTTRALPTTSQLGPMAIELSSIRRWMTPRRFHHWRLRGAGPSVGVHQPAGVYGHLQTRLEYQIRHFAAGDGIGFDEADQRYVNATGDTMTGPLKLKQKSTNSTVLNFYDETDQNFFALRSEAAPQDGGPGTTARLNIAKGKQFKIVSLEADKQLFKIYKNGNVFLAALLLRLTTPMQQTKSTLMTPLLASAVVTPAICHCLAAR